MKKKIISILIVLIIVLNPICAYAESAPGTVTVEGGTIGSGGINGNSGVLKGTALAVIMATLASAGIAVKVAVDDYQRGNSAINFLEDKFEEWDAKTDEAWNAYDKYRALNETKVGEDGSLYIPEQAAAIMQKFLNWLVSESAISQLPTVDNDQTLINGTYASDRFIYDNGNYMIAFQNYTDGQPKTMAFVLVQSGSNYILNLYCKFPNVEYRRYRKNGDGWVYDYSRGTGNSYLDYFVLRNFMTLSTPIIGAEIVENFDVYLQSLSGQFEEGYANPGIDLTGFYGDTADIPSLVDESGNGKILKVNPGLIGQVQDGYVGSGNASIGIQDYLDALTDLYNQKALPQDITDLPDIAINGVDALTGTKEQVGVIDRDVALDQDITVPADDTSITWPEVPSGSTPISDSSTIDPDVAIPAMAFDLTNYFPFCIPFDIYNLLSKLNAEPVTPVIVIDWGNILGSIGVDYEMTIDLSEYNDIAAILRTMELFAFIIGLGVATRSMYIRG